MTIKDQEQSSVGKAYNGGQPGACRACGGAGSVWDANARNEAGGQGKRSKCGACKHGWTHEWHAARDAERAANGGGPVVRRWPAHAAGYVD